MTKRKVYEFNEKDVQDALVNHFKVDTSRNVEWEAREGGILVVVVTNPHSEFDPEQFAFGEDDDFSEEYESEFKEAKEGESWIGGQPVKGPDKESRSSNEKESS